MMLVAYILGAVATATYGLVLYSRYMPTKASHSNWHLMVGVGSLAWSIWPVSVLAIGLSHYMMTRVNRGTDWWYWRSRPLDR